MAYLIGIGLAVAAAIFARGVGLDRDRAFYPTVMIVIALLYVLFAAIDGSAKVLLPGIAVCVGFVALTVAGYKRSLWLVVAALAGHGIYDILHPHLLQNRGVPVWWPEFCMAYDVAAAAVLGVLIFRQPHRTQAGKSP